MPGTAGELGVMREHGHDLVGRWALGQVPRIWKQHKCPLTDEGIKKT